MKQTFLHLIFSFFALAFISPLVAQITIDESNFIRPPFYTDTVVVSQGTNLSSPTTGSDQVWDYSSLQMDFLSESEHFDGTNDPEMPGATGYYPSNLTFQFFLIPNLVYETVDQEGWYIRGYKAGNSSNDISFVTGSAGDTLRFPPATKVFDEKILWTKFPMNYEDEWTTTRTEITDFELTVAAFGLDKTPGYRKQFTTDNRKVTGSGQVTLPSLDGSPIYPIDALMVEGDVTRVDSFFLGGAPAPQALLDAFGLVQGGTSVFNGFFLYAPGFGSAVLFGGIGTPGVYQYRPQVNNIISSVREVTVPQLASFPNPISAGESLTIEMETIPMNGNVSLLDFTGRMVHAQAFESPTGQSLQINVPSELGKGMYVFQVHDGQGQLTGVGKVQKQ